MLYIFHGTDIDKSRTKAQTLINSLRVKKPDAAFVKFEADDWNISALESHLGGQGLFSNKYIIFLDRVTENPEAKDHLGDFVEVMNESDNIFILLEGKLLADLKKVFDKHAEKVVISDVPEAGKSFSTKKDFNIFSLADALGARDSFKAWNIYRQAIDGGIEPENIIGTLFWQVKSMILAHSTSTAGEAGLNPFVFGKSKRYSGNFSDSELTELSNDLIIAYHDSHRGIHDFSIALERFILTI